MYSPALWAARYDSWLLITLMPKVLFFSFLFFSFLFFSFLFFSFLFFSFLFFSPAQELSRSPQHKECWNSREVYC